MDAGSFGLQSGFVLAVILLAVFIADRIGGGEAVGRRAFQVGLGVMIAFTAISGTHAFIRPPDVPESVRESGFDVEDDEESYEYFEDVADRDSAATTVHAGIGVMALIAGLYAMRRFMALPLGVVVGGLLLILFGGVTQGGESTDAGNAFFALYASLLNATLGGASLALDVAHFAVLLAGTVALMLFGYVQWEERRSAPEATPAEV